MPLQATSGAASYDAFGGGVPFEPIYIEQVFQNWLYTGNGSTQTITNNIDLAGEGGLVWIKDRSAAVSHGLFDTVRGVNNYLSSNSANEQNVFGVVTNALTAFNSNGFSVGTSLGWLNASGDNLASWTFRKQPKFFDVVTYTGTGSTQTIAHNLGSVPGCIIVKATNDTRSWAVYHRSLGATKYIYLNSTGIGGTTNGFWDDTEPTSTVFTVRNDGDVNGPGTTYVAYLFAHNAGGFGLSGTDNVISCGSVVNTGNPQVTLGYEPQWVLFKSSTSTSPWYIVDNMRGLPVGADQAVLLPNSTAAEVTNSNYININATGFTTNSSLLAGQTLIYIAIRRGPMRTPTTGTSVYQAEIGNSSSAPEFNAGFPVDMALMKDASGVEDWYNSSRLLQGTYLVTNSTATEGASSNFNFAYQSGWYATATTRTSWMFRRAPGFFDEVCYTGDSTARTLAHNLGVAPELWIIKRRSGTSNWIVGGGILSSPTNNFLLLNGTTQQSSITDFFTTPTSTTFGFGSGAPSDNSINASGQTYVAYLFASAPGVSKVGTFTGTGATQVIDCGFTGGARFVLIKATSTTGPWLVWDSARGIVSGDDPYLVLNSTAAEVTNTDWVDTAATGFELSNAAGNGANNSGISYLFMAIA